MHGQSHGTQGIDNDFASKSFENVAAWLLGRNVFGPVRGPWEGDSGKDGGAIIRRITRRFLCSRITGERR